MHTGYIFLSAKQNNTKQQKQDLLIDSNIVHDQHWYITGAHHLLTTDNNNSDLVYHWAWILPLRHAHVVGVRLYCCQQQNMQQQQELLHCYI